MDAPEPEQDGGQSSSGASKSKRAFARVACDRCRRLKQGCDGARPSCSHCVRRSLACNYERDLKDGESRQRAIRRELEDTNKRLEDVLLALGRLKWASNEEAFALVRRLRAADDPMDELCRATQQITRKPGLSEHQANRAVLPPTRTKVAYELSQSHGHLFPILIPIDSASFAVEAVPNSSVPYAHEHGVSPIVTSTWEHQSHSFVDSTTQLAPQDPTSTLSYSTTPSLNYGLYSPPLNQSNPSVLLDARLQHLDISKWTDVQIHSDLAARMISYYLEAYHPTFGFFDAELFINSLITGYGEYCSPFLVSALLYWVSHAYGPLMAISTLRLRDYFLEEARRRCHDLHTTAPQTPNLLTVSGCLLLSIGLACDGIDELSLQYHRYGRQTAEHLGLFNSAHDAPHPERSPETTANDLRAAAHVAWGAYAWINVFSELYQMPLIPQPPAFQIPSGGPAYMGRTFEAVCHLRVIGSEVNLAYHIDDERAIADRVSIKFVEDIFQRLLYWTDQFDTSQNRGPDAKLHVIVLHIWVHILILDIFRPFLGKGLKLDSFTSADSSPEAISDASLAQLKSLLIICRRGGRRWQYNIMWHTVLLYVSNAILMAARDADSEFYLDQCVEGYLWLLECYRVSAGFLQGLIGLAVERGGLTAFKARQILARLNRRAEALQISTAVDSQHVVDLSIETRERSAASIQAVTRKLEDLTREDPP